MSGYSADVIGHGGVLDAHTAFLQKPFSWDVLRRHVRETLGAAAEPLVAPLGTLAVKGA